MTIVIHFGRNEQRIKLNFTDTKMEKGAANFNYLSASLDANYEKQINCKIRLIFIDRMNDGTSSHCSNIAWNYKRIVFNKEKSNVSGTTLHVHASISDGIRIHTFLCVNIIQCW